MSAPVAEYTGRCIAIVHRTDEDDDKRGGVPDSGTHTDDKYLRAFEDGTMPPDACGPRIEELRDKIAGLESRKADLESEATVSPQPPSFEDVAEAAERLGSTLEAVQGGRRCGPNRP